MPKALVLGPMVFSYGEIKKKWAICYVTHTPKVKLTHLTWRVERVQLLLLYSPIVSRQFLSLYSRLGFFGPSVRFLFSWGRALRMLTARYTHICGGGVGLKKFRISARLLLRRVRSAWLPANDPESRGSHGVRLVDARAQSDDIRRRKRKKKPAIDTWRRRRSFSALLSHKTRLKANVVSLTTKDGNKLWYLS